MRFRGFTLIELLVSLAIIVLMLAMAVLFYRVGESQLALERASHKLAQDIRRAQELAVSARQLPGKPVPRGGYGLYFNLANPSTYILFADEDENRVYSGSSELVEEISLEPGVVINGLLPSSPLHIVFMPPDPVVTIQGDASINSATVELNLGKKKIKINKTGMIEIK